MKIKPLEEYRPKGKFGQLFQDWILDQTGNPKIPLCVDKYSVKEYVKKYDVLVPNNLSKRTNNCVVKANNDSYGLLIIIDGKTVYGTEDRLYKHTNDKPHYEAHKIDHWFYKDIPHTIFIEEYLSGHDIDYQFFCYKGRAGLCQVRNSKRFSAKGKHKPANSKSREMVVLRDGTVSDIGIVRRNVYDKNMPIPEHVLFQKMWQLADEMSNEFEFARVDLFVHDNKIYFGEYTFSPNGFEFGEGDELLWESVVQPILDKRNKL